MELQVFSSKGEICLKTEPHSFLYDQLLRYVEGTPYYPLLVSLEKDFQVAHSDLSALLDRVAADIKHLREELRALPQFDAPRDQLIELMILGEKLLLAVRFPPHAQLLQLHYFYLDIRKASEDNCDLLIFLIPALTSIQFRMLKLLKDATDGLDIEHLQAVLNREYQRLSGMEIVTEEIKQRFNQDVADLNREGAIAESIAVLLKWDLLHEDVMRRRIVATRKLRLIQL